MAARGDRGGQRPSEPLEQPKGLRRARRPGSRRDAFGAFSESFARAMGTSTFLIALTVFVAIWLIYNAIAPADAQFDPVSNGFAVMTLILSLQASYAAPLILLAQNRQDDRDRVQVEQDRQRSERNLDDTEYLAREIVALRLLVRDVASKDFVRSELRSMLDELDRRDAERREDDRADRAADRAGVDEVQDERDGGRPMRRPAAS